MKLILNYILKNGESREKILETIQNKALSHICEQIYEKCTYMNFIT